MRGAQHVLVTAPSALELLEQRHGPIAGASVVPQGFDELVARRAVRQPEWRSDGGLQLLYAGTFYAFRDPRSLVEAVVAGRGVSLSIASGNVPDWLVDLAVAHPDKLVLLGSVPHRELLALQRESDVLVNLANIDPCQVPGKLYEYFGACRPILHLSQAPNDASGALLSRLRRGWACGNDLASVARMLDALAEAHGRGCLEAGLQLGLESVQSWSWTASARRVERILLGVADTVR